jgi:hypothetical protein
LLDDADGAGIDVCREDAVEPFGHLDHVRAILPGAQNPIDFLRRGIVATEGFVGLRGEIEFAASEGQPVSGRKAPRLMEAAVSARVRSTPEIVFRLLSFP